MTKIGIIDLGSNSARLGIYDLVSKEAIYMGKCPVRLSDGMNKDMIIRDTAVNRTVLALIGFLEILKRHRVEKIYALATAAIRKAKNQAEVLGKIKAETGLDIRVLSGEEEAELDFLGVIGKTKMKDAIILDTGGGSIEIIGSKNGKMLYGNSIPVGSRSIKELFFSGGETDEARKRAEMKIEEILDSLSWFDEFKGIPIIGIGGCNRTVARIFLEDRGSDKPIKSCQITYDEVFKIFDKIENTAVEERGSIRGITPDRIDIIYGGLLPLKAVMTRLDSPFMTVTDAGLKEGFLEKLRNSATL